MKNLLIIGAGGCGREVMQWAIAVNKKTSIWNIKGYLDKDENALDGLKSDYPIVGSEDSYEIQENDEFVCAIADSNIRKNIIEKLEKRGAVFVSIIHPTAIIADTAKLGKAEILYPFAIVSDNVEIGDGCIINSYSGIGHDSKVGEYSTLSAHCDITGHCNVGKKTFWGSGSRCAPYSKIGDNATVGIGSVVLKKVAANTTVFGVPAKKIEF